ncbi:MAG: MATE family efflux transporter [Hyphomicrobiales bacterium]|nr:MAG: MATE family efflux transporter [Hyphomicrobiales bacterium]
MANKVLGEKPFEITNRLVFSLAVPVTLAYLTTPLLGLVDTAVVGQFGDAAMIGGLAVGAIIIDLIFVAFNFLRVSTSGLTAQAFGREDEVDSQAILFRAVGVGLVFGIGAMLLGPLLVKLGLWMMQPGASVAAATTTYVTVRVFGAPFTAINYAMLGWFLGQGRTGVALGLQVLLSVINIILSIAFGLWLGWGIFGVAIATVIGEIVASLAGAFLCYRMLDHSKRPSRNIVLDGGALKRLLGLNFDIVLRNFALIFAFAFFTTQGARFGEVTLAANAILMHFFIMTAYFLDGLALAAEQLSGRAIGAKYRAGFWRAFKLTSAWNGGLAFVLASMLYLGGSTLIDFLTVLDSVRDEAKTYMLWACLTPITGVVAYQLDGVFFGGTWTREISKMMVVSLIIYVLIWWLTRDSMGNHGLWLSLNCFLVIRGILLLIRVGPVANATFAKMATK